MNKFIVFIGFLYTICISYAAANNLKDESNVFSVVNEKANVLKTMKEQELKEQELKKILGRVCDKKSYTFSSQTQIDSFSEHCNVITGNLTIGRMFGEPTDIVELSTISNISEVKGSLNIVNNAMLSDLSDLNRIESIGRDVNIRSNRVLKNVDDFINASKVTGNINISANTKVSNDIQDDVLCTANDFYQLRTQDDVDDFGQYHCTKIQGSLYIGSYSNVLNGVTMNNLNGLKTIKSISGDLSIVNVKGLTNIDSLSNLTLVGGNLDIRYLTDLIDINGLRNLTSLQGSLTIGGNRRLTSIQGISKIRSVFSSITIFINSALTDLNGLNVKQIFEPSDKARLVVFGNYALKKCSQLCSLLESSTVGSNVKIYQNSSGMCADKQSVLSFCAANDYIEY